MNMNAHLAALAANEKAVNGIGPGSTKGARKLATERAMREFRKSQKEAK